MYRSMQYCMHAKRHVTINNIKDKHMKRSVAGDGHTEP